jgi:hypothetical protein
LILDGQMEVYIEDKLYITMYTNNFFSN